VNILSLLEWKQMLKRPVFTLLASNWWCFAFMPRQGDVARGKFDAVARSMSKVASGATRKAVCSSLPRWRIMSHGWDAKRLLTKGTVKVSFVWEKEKHIIGTREWFLFHLYLFHCS